MARTGNIILTKMNNLSLESFEKKSQKHWKYGQFQKHIC